MPSTEPDENTGLTWHFVHHSVHEIWCEKDVWFISVISLMEVLYLAEKHRIPINLPETLGSSLPSSAVSALEDQLRGLTSLAKPSLASRHYQAELGNEVNEVIISL